MYKVSFQGSRNSLKDLDLDLRFNSTTNPTEIQKRTNKDFFFSFFHSIVNIRQ